MNYKLVRMTLILVITGICFPFYQVTGQHISSEIDESYFEYPYKKVLDYYVINAWSGLNHTVPAYTPEMVARHTSLLLGLPWVEPTPSADEHGIIGKTPGWALNPDYPDDPEIPRQNIYGYMITDPYVNSPKIKMILTSGTGEGLHVTYPYVYEPGGWSRERLKESGKNLALALYEVLAGKVK